MRISLLSFAAAAADKTENFYKDGLDKISSDFTTIITNSDIKDATAERYVTKIEKSIAKDFSTFTGMQSLEYVPQKPLTTENFQLG